MKRGFFVGDVMNEFDLSLADSFFHEHIRECFKKKDPLAVLSTMSNELGLSFINQNIIPSYTRIMSFPE